MTLLPCPRRKSGTVGSARTEVDAGVKSSRTYTVREAVPVESIALLAGHDRTATTESVYRREIRPALTQARR